MVATRDTYAAQNLQVHLSLFRFCGVEPDSANGPPTNFVHHCGHFARVVVGVAAPHCAFDIMSTIHYRLKNANDAGSQLYVFLTLLSLSCIVASHCVVRKSACWFDWVVHTTLRTCNRRSVFDYKMGMQICPTTSQWLDQGNVIDSVISNPALRSREHEDA